MSRSKIKHTSFPITRSAVRVADKATEGSGQPLSGTVSDNHTWRPIEAEIFIDGRPNGFHDVKINSGEIPHIDNSRVKTCENGNKEFTDYIRGKLRVSNGVAVITNRITWRRG